MAKIRMDQVLMDLNGYELQNQVPSGEKNLLGQDVLVNSGPLTLETVATNALVAHYQDEPNLSGEEKVKRWMIAMKIKGKENGSREGVDLSVDEIALIKKVIGKAYSALIVGQAWKILEGE